MQETSSADRQAAVVEDLISVLQNPHPPTPFLQKGDPPNDAIKQLQIIFNVPDINNVTDNNNRTNNQSITNRSVPRVIQSVPRVQRPVSSVQRLVPRVRTTLPTNHRRPRVETRRMAPINEERRIYTIGTIVRKKFNRFNHIGKIIKYNEDNE